MPFAFFFIKLQGMKRIFFILFLTFSSIVVAQDGMHHISQKSTMEVVINFETGGEFKYKSDEILETDAVEFKNGLPVFRNFTLKIPATSIKSWLKPANDMLMETIKADKFPLNSVSFSAYEADGYCMADIEIAGVKKINEHFEAKLDKKRENFILECHWHGSLKAFDLTLPEIMGGNVKPEDEFDVNLRLIFD